MHTKNKLKKIFAGVTLLLMLQMTFSSLAYAVDEDWFGNAVEDVGSWLTSGGSDTTTSFTDFKGGLQAPSKEGYAGSLTQASDARTFVLNVTNFILGFLGLTAVIVIIYGGFVYVTAAGDEGKTEKGKKSVSYAIIGILMILASFAIVNTVLQAPSGTDSPNKGSAEEQANTSGTVQRRFNVLASRVQEMAKSILVAYKFHFDSQKDINDIIATMQSAKDHIDKCAQIGCGDNWGDGLYDALLFWRMKADAAIQKLQHIKSVAPTTLFYSLAIRSTVDDTVAYIDTYWNTALARASAKADENGCDDNVLKPCDGNESGGPENRAVFMAFQAEPFDMKKFENDDEKINTLKEVVGGNFSATLNDTKKQLNGMYKQVSAITDVATEAFTKLVEKTYLQKDALTIASEKADGVTGGLYDLVQEVNSTETPEQAQIKDEEPLSTLSKVIGQMGALYSILKDILFVDAKITASSVSGNAPLIVNFSSVGSLDPSGITITENQIAWDLDGDGVYGEKVIDGDTDPVMNCNEGAITDADLTQTDKLITATSPVATSCVYKKPGTYRVKLKIRSAHDLNPVTGKTYDKEIGVGLSTIDINVLPAQTRINLTIDNAPGGAVNVMKYKDDGSGLIEEDRQAVVFPLSIAKSSGVQFNAATTKDKDNQLLSGQAGDGATALWDFDNNANDGVNKVLLPASELKPAAAKYDKAGDYNVSLELTDKNKVLDRKLFALKVSALVPVLQLSKPSANVGDEVTFDGSNSVSDNGQISSYTWQITPALPGIPAAELTKDTFKYKFTEPGKYTVKLTVDDGIEPTPVSVSEELSVTSKPPVAQFTYEIPDQHKPSTVVFNGTKSYDPDATDPSKVLKYRWEVNGKALTDGATGSEPTYSYDNKDPNYPKITFAQKGDYTVTLVAIDTIGGSTQESLAFEKTVNISSVIDVAWKNAPSDKTAIILAKDATTQEQKATASMTLESKNGVSYDVDYGDGETEQGDFSNTKTLTHDYKATGTYVVKASVFDKDDEENFVTRKVYVGADNQPIASVTVKINGEDVIPDAVDPLVINRKDILTLSGAESKNVDGTGRRLVYSWNLGDSELSAKESVTKTYKNLGDYEVKLTVKNANDLSMPAGNDTLKISVIGEKPTLKTITAVPTGTSLTTPVTVATTAVGAEDLDGKVIRYRWWYFSPSAPDDQLGVQVTTTPTANITIGTRGEEGAQVPYYFGVELTDDENNTISSGDVIDPKTTELTVTNGPNKAPVAKFNVDRTNVFVGESAEFTSSSSDPDGTIKAYYWDWEGDGFANNNKDEGPNVTHVFDKSSKDGIKVRLQVIDSNESPAISDPVVIYVDSKAQPPVAAFTSTQEGTTKKMTLKNNSTVDKDNAVSLASAVWDFDVNVDSNGDGKKDNDEDAKVTDQVSYEYPDYGIYRAKLTITDSNKQTSQVTNFVNVKAAAAPPAPTPTPTPKPAAPTPTPTPTTPPATPSTQLDARLLTIPETSFSDGKIHLKGESATVTLDYSSSTGKIKTYIIDKNVFYDTNGNNVKEDDEDYKSTSAGKWTTEFFKSYGQTKVRLTVVGEDGKKDFVEKEIVFDKDVTPAKTGKVSVFDTETDTAVILLVCAAGFGILSLNLYRSKNKKPNA